MTEKDNMTEKDKLYRTIRKLLVIGAITIAVLFVFAIIVSITANAHIAHGLKY